MRRYRWGCWKTVIVASYSDYMALCSSAVRFMFPHVGHSVTLSAPWQKQRFQRYVECYISGTSPGTMVEVKMFWILTSGTTLQFLSLETRH